MQIFKKNICKLFKKLGEGFSYFSKFPFPVSPFRLWKEESEETKKKNLEFFFEKDEKNLVYFLQKNTFFPGEKMGDCIFTKYNPHPILYPEFRY